jgi:hypothetical protein
MNIAIVNLCKALGQLLNSYFNTFDRETSDLMQALAAFVEKYGK